MSAHPVAKWEDIPPGQSALVTVDGKEVAVFNVEGRYYAVGNRCPHRSGPLVRGQIESVDGVAAVRCPLHGWLFELGTGRGLTRAGASIACYPVSCEEDDLLVGPPQGDAAGPTVSGQIQS